MLPVVDTCDERDVLTDETLMRPGAEDLCARLGFADAPLSRLAGGSRPVYAVGSEHVLKLYPGTTAREDAAAEGRVLEHVQGRLPVPTPQVREAGSYENGWQYVLMSRLHGQDLAHAWDRVPPHHRQRLVAEVGQALAALHRLDPDPVTDVIGPGDWDAFLDQQAAGAAQRQAIRELPSEWLEQIPPFLASVPLPRAPRRCLLHTEVMHQHLLVDTRQWRLTGLFDFESAMIGDRGYEFASVGVFVTRGDPDLLARLTNAYGHTFDPRELLAYALLHKYSNLSWYMRELGVPAEGTLHSLAEAWFGTT